MAYMSFPGFSNQFFHHHIREENVITKKQTPTRRMEVQNHNVLHNNAFFNVIETAVMLSKQSLTKTSTSHYLSLFFCSIIGGAAAAAAIMDSFSHPTSNSPSLKVPPDSKLFSSSARRRLKYKL